LANFPELNLPQGYFNILTNCQLIIENGELLMKNPEGVTG